jgi:hypothetical protein
LTGDPAIRTAISVFMNSGEDPERTIFLTLTEREACFVHLSSVLALAGIKLAYEQDKKAVEPLLAAALVADVELWTKIIGAMNVQLFGEDVSEL